MILLKDIKEVIDMGQGGLFLRKQYQLLGGLFRILAFIYRRTFIRNTSLIAVVGSLGKTTTRSVLHAALDCPDRKFSPANYGTALARNVLRIRPGDAYAVIEAGIGGPGWMKTYSKFLNPRIIVVTSVASDHHRSFPTLEHTRNEKVQIVRRMAPSDVVFLNGDDPNVLWMATQTVAKVITFGFNPSNNVRAEKIQVNPNGMDFEAVTGSKRQKIHTRLTGRHMIYPILAAVAVADDQGFDLLAVAERTERVMPVKHRMQVLQVPGDYQIIDDTYKAGLETYFSSLEALADLPAKRKFLFFADIDDAPGNHRECLREIGSRAATVVNKIYCFTSRKRGQPLRAAAVSAGMNINDIVFLGSDLDLAFNTLRQDLLPGDVLLLKGRQNNKIQRISLMLMGHEITCRVKYCDLKPSSCLACPFVNNHNQIKDNYFVRKYFKEAIS